MNKILVVVDMQNDFLTGVLANDSAVEIIPNIKREIESGYYDHIIFTRDTHLDETYLNTQEGRKLPYPHCILGTWGWKICDELTASAQNCSYYPLNKDSFGVASDEWRYFLKNTLNLNGNDCEFTFTGTCTNICVNNNISTLKATFKEAPVRVIADCCAAYGENAEERKRNNENTLDVISYSQVEVIR